MIRHLNPASYKVMPWKNGGGSTTELFVAPGPTGFRWRVSIASVSQDGPFSVFAGYDRHIMTLSGAGMVLDCGPQGEIAVTPALVPKTFSGDWKTSARLLEGPVQDYNLMVERSYARSSLDCLRLDAPINLDGNGLHFVTLITGKAYVAAGSASFPVAEMESVLCDEPLRISPVAGAAQTVVAVCHVRSSAAAT